MHWERHIHRKKIFLKKALKRDKISHEHPRNILVVSHEGFILELLNVLYSLRKAQPKIPLECSECSLYKIKFTKNKKT